MNIQINQVGYRPNDNKTATFRIGDTMSVSDSLNLSEKISNTFRIIEAATGKTVYSGTLSDAVSNDQTGEINRVADFSDFKSEGRFYIESDDNGKSHEFDIKNDIYDDLFRASMKMFFLQRCGCELKKAHAGVFAHPSCHDTLARIYGTDKFIDVSGAWHDAGDYGRYIVAAAKAVVDLMMAYEYYPDIMEESFDIPESGNGIPDILDEVKYELDWMLKMQDKETGGVYHKVTCVSFPGFVMPQMETEELVVCPISDTATCDFAASMAYAYRVYSKLSDKYGKAADKYVEASKIYLEAAKKAMGYLENTSAGPFVNPEGVITGEYGDERTIDEFYWAYAEMYKTTGEKKYEDAMKSIDLTSVPGEFGWKEVGDYAFYAYITAPFDKDEELYKLIYNRFVSENAEKIEKYNQDPYGSTLYGFYYWGCNMEVANNAMRAIIIDRLEGTSKYSDMVSAQLHYLLGNNPSAMCFVTGFGSDSPKNPHHRPSKATSTPMPGMLVGGPEPLLLDDTAKELLNGYPPAKCYIDHLESYSTNEITIYWNSPLVFLLAYMKSK